VVEDDGVVKFERNPTAALVPASSQKLLVAAAALSRLGPDFRFETKVVAAHAPRDGTLEDAWFVGAGDPFLVTPDYAAYVATRPRSRDLPLTPLAVLADELVARGVRVIPGGFRPDESRYETQRYVPSWKPSYVAKAEVGSLGALTVNEGLAGWGPSQAVAADPAAGTVVALSNLLAQRGVALPPPSAAGTAPRGAVMVASVRSAPLAEIVGAMLRASDNFAAEMLLREVDRQSGGEGSTAGGAARVVDEAGRLGLPTEGVHLVDGSGLDLGNRASCRALLGALNLSRQPPFAVLDTGLAVAGRSGTLVKRFVGSPVEGRLAAKTGWVLGVAAMVGRLEMEGHPTRRFALVVNGSFNWPTARSLEDRVVDVLATAPG
jgi:D-alanyl-D-alanine carboxypeptidase/D-alanyl-D-alanine-endopeptidase (penicillin-binding protein 4)